MNKSPIKVILPIYSRATDVLLSDSYGACVAMRNNLNSNDTIIDYIQVALAEIPDTGSHLEVYETIIKLFGEMFSDAPPNAIDRLVGFYDSRGLYGLEEAASAFSSGLKAASYMALSVQAKQRSLDTIYENFEEE